MKFDIAIIGAGIIGLATALKLKEKNAGLNIAVFEKEDSIARHQTGNNSGVIHAGVYYKAGSLKATNCLTGYRMLLDFCDEHNVTYDICGKLIVATGDQELLRLENLYERARQNGLSKVEKVRGEQIKDYEPHATGKAAIFVPYTGIIDYTEVSRKYAELFSEKYGGYIFTNSKVEKIHREKDGFTLVTGSGEYQCSYLVNTAGLYSDKVAELSGKKIDCRIIPFRGEYTVLREEKKHLVKNLIYPVPDPNFPFLGVHFTRMIRGGIEAGPNAVWAFKREGYKKTSFNFSEFSESLAWPGFRKVMAKYWKMGLGEYYRSYSKAALARALQKLVPEVTKEDLVPGGAGVRAQACSRQGGLVDDFLILENHRQMDILNAPSPAATASLAIGRTIAEKVLAKVEKKSFV
jgi:(S)-2-hydroxyglutarate dehydrogenase